MFVLQCDSCGKYAEGITTRDPKNDPSVPPSWARVTVRHTNSDKVFAVCPSCLKEHGLKIGVTLLTIETNGAPPRLNRV